MPATIWEMRQLHSVFATAPAADGEASKEKAAEQADPAPHNAEVDEEPRPALLTHGAPKAFRVTAKVRAIASPTKAMASRAKAKASKLQRAKAKAAEAEQWREKHNGQAQSPGASQSLLLRSMGGSKTGGGAGKALKPSPSPPPALDASKTTIMMPPSDDGTHEEDERGSDSVEAPPLEEYDETDVALQSLLDAASNYAPPKYR